MNTEKVDTNDPADGPVNRDDIDRRGFLKCMAWAGTGVVLSMRGGVLVSEALGAVTTSAPADFSFVQISDSHIGFSKDANKSVTETLQRAISRISELETGPDFLIHTGDVSHMSMPDEFDAASAIVKSGKTTDVFYVPGEHDVLKEHGKQYRERFGRGSRGDGWYSFDHKGCHFVGLVNVMNLTSGALGTLGSEQLEWLESDLKHRKADTPIVVFAHIPLWSVYPDWGWGTQDSARALTYLKKFGSVTVLNGHIHQTMQKVEGNVTFHTACSTAFPQPKPGGAAGPGPMKVPDERLRSLLGITAVHCAVGSHTLGLIDSTLE